MKVDSFRIITERVWFLVFLFLTLHVIPMTSRQIHLDTIERPKTSFPPGVIKTNKPSLIQASSEENSVWTDWDTPQEWDGSTISTKASNVQQKPLLSPVASRQVSPCSTPEERLIEDPEKQRIPSLEAFHEALKKKMGDLGISEDAMEEEDDIDTLSLDSIVQSGDPTDKTYSELLTAFREMLKARYDGYLDDILKTETTSVLNPFIHALANPREPIVDIISRSLFCVEEPFIASKTLEKKKVIKEEIKRVKFEDEMEEDHPQPVQIQKATEEFFRNMSNLSRDSLVDRLLPNLRSSCKTIYDHFLNSQIEFEPLLKTIPVLNNDIDRVILRLLIYQVKQPTIIETVNKRFKEYLEGVDLPVDDTFDNIEKIRDTLKRYERLRELKEANDEQVDFIIQNDDYANSFVVKIQEEPVTVLEGVIGMENLRKWDIISLDDLEPPYISFLHDAMTMACGLDDKHTFGQLKDMLQNIINECAGEQSISTKEEDPFFDKWLKILNGAGTTDDLYPYFLVSIILIEREKARPILFRLQAKYVRFAMVVQCTYEYYIENHSADKIARNLTQMETWAKILWEEDADFPRLGRLVRSDDIPRRTKTRTDTHYYSYRPTTKIKPYKKAEIVESYEKVFSQPEEQQQHARTEESKAKATWTSFFSGWFTN